MKITISSEVRNETGIENLIQMAHIDHNGQILRVSEYMEKDGIHRPLSEMIYYPDGSKNLHLYNDAGDVEKVIRYDKYGFEIPNPPEHSMMQIHLEQTSIKGMAS